MLICKNHFIEFFDSIYFIKYLLIQIVLKFYNTYENSYEVKYYILKMFSFLPYGKSM